MPQYNGTQGRTFGQAYARHKGGMEDKKGKEHEEMSAEGGEKDGAKGSVVHVKHMGGGKYKTRHDGGEMKEHGSKAEMLAHLDEHYPEDDNESEQEMPHEGMGDMGESLKSILS